jgi:hypothetical protein
MRPVCINFAPVPGGIPDGCAEDFSHAIRCCNSGEAAIDLSGIKRRLRETFPVPQSLTDSIARALARVEFATKDQAAAPAQPQRFQVCVH